MNSPLGKVQPVGRQAVDLVELSRRALADQGIAVIPLEAVVDPERRRIIREEAERLLRRRSSMRGEGA